MASASFAHCSGTFQVPGIAAMSITDIAYACGFSSTSYFCELFHKHYNITPITYRKQNL